MSYKNNIHLSKNELKVLIDCIETKLNSYVESKDDREILNNSYINILFNAASKIYEKQNEMSGHMQLDWDSIVNKWKNEVAEISRDKILKLNNKHIVKTDFLDMSDFNRWEKIRTYNKQ